MTLTWRPITADDVPQWAALLAAAEREDDTGENYSAEDLAEELSAPDADPEHDSIAAWDGDRMVAYGATRPAHSPQADGTLRVYLEGTVAPDRRRQGIGAQVLDWTCTRGAEAAGDRKAVLDSRMKADLPGTRELYGARGFAETRYFFGMSRTPEKVDAEAPAGLTLAPFDPAYSEQTRQAHNEAFADHWGSSEQSAESWQHWVAGSRNFRPQASFLLLDGDEVAAYLMGYEYEADTAVTGRRELYVGQLGTRRAWRKRGAGRTLLAAALTAAAGDEYKSVALDVDSSSPTGALGLYESVGFTLDRKTVSWTRQTPTADRDT